MKRPGFCLMTALLSAFFSSSAFAAGAIICADMAVPVPDGFIVKSYFYTPACGKDAKRRDNTYVITPLSDSEKVCKVTGVPEGYVITSHFYDYTCGKGASIAENTYRLKKPELATTGICKFSPIPKGYSIAKSTNKAGCGVMSIVGNAYMLKKTPK